MNEKPIMPTKKQRELLTFIEAFIVQNSYSPSYREIMKGLDYTSVATVSLHVNSLIKRGHLRKRDHSARSLELVSPSEKPKVSTNQIKPAEEKWLVDRVEHFFKELESTKPPSVAKLDELYVLIGAMKVLGMDGAVTSFLPRLKALKANK